MKSFIGILVIPVLLLLNTECELYAQTAAGAQKPALPLYKADHKFINYSGRFDLTNRVRPKCWAPGACIHAKFRGTSCEIVINDEMPVAGYHNYLEVIIDNKKPFRVKLRGRNNTVKAAGGLVDGEHTITICKNSDATVGYLEFIGLRCAELLPAPMKPLRKIEFIGSSATTGTGSDRSETACNNGQWFDNDNAYYSYGAVTARMLRADWQISAVRGIGLTESEPHVATTLPDAIDNIDMSRNVIPWDVTRYQPHVVTIAAGEKNELQDSTTFCNAYSSFLQKLRGYYPKAEIICMSNPALDAASNATLQNYITAIVSAATEKGDNMLTNFFFTSSYHNGCGGNPSIADHKRLAAELSAYISRLKGW